MQNEFGGLTRTATDDANEGIIYKPQDNSVVARGQDNTKQITRDTQLDEAVDDFATNFGSALDQVAENAETIKQEKRAQEAVIRQSLRTTINEVDETAKRTGWTQAFAGQSVQYRSAQIQANKNLISEAELDEQTNLWKKAHMTPDQYLQERQAKMEEFTDRYKDDPDAKRELAAEYIAASARLSQAQYKEHYAYTQTQMYNETVRGLEIAIDKTTLMTQDETDPEKIKAMHDGISQAFKSKEGQIPLEARIKALHEVSNKQLRNGNIIFYREMKARGLYNDATDKQQETLQKSIEQFDQQQNYTFRQVVDNLRYRSEPNISVPDQWKEYEKSLAQLQAAEPYLSNSPLSRKNWELAIADLIKMKPKVLDKEAQWRAREAAIENGAIHSSPLAQSIEENKEYSIGTGGSKRKLTSKERQLVADWVTKKEIALSIGITDKTAVKNMTSEQEMVALVTNPAIASNITQKIMNTDYVPVQFKTLTKNFMAGYETAANVVDGKADADFLAIHNTLKSIRDVDFEYFTKMLGSDAGKFEMISLQLDAGKTPEAIKQQFEEGELLKQTDGVKPIPKTEDGTQVDYLKETFGKELGEYPSGGDLTRVAKWYKDGLAYNRNDDDAAKHYVKAMLSSTTIKVFGKTVAGGRYLETLADAANASRDANTNFKEQERIGFNEVMEHISDKDVGIAQIVIKSLQKDADGYLPQTDLRKLPGFTITPDPKREGFWMNAQGSPKGKVFVDKTTYIRWYMDARRVMQQKQLIDEQYQRSMLDPMVEEATLNPQRL